VIHPDPPTEHLPRKIRPPAITSARSTIDTDDHLARPKEILMIDSTASATSMPTVDDYRRRAAEQGLAFELPRYAAALEAHAALHDALLRLRAVPLSFLEPTEPNSALVWLESGGVSTPSAFGANR
jgi:hypothetical protein